MKSLIRSLLSRRAKAKQSHSAFANLRIEQLEDRRMLAAAQALRLPLEGSPPVNLQGDFWDAEQWADGESAEWGVAADQAATFLNPNATWDLKLNRENQDVQRLQVRGGELTLDLNGTNLNTTNGVFGVWSQPDALLRATKQAAVPLGLGISEDGDEGTSVLALVNRDPDMIPNTITADEVIIGGKNHGSLLLSGSGVQLDVPAKWEDANFGTLFVGFARSGSVEVEDGATLTSARLVMGMESDAALADGPNVLSVQGEGSVLTTYYSRRPNTMKNYVGYTVDGESTSTRNSVLIADSGHWESGRLLIGSRAPGMVQVIGGSTMQVHSHLNIGGFGYDGPTWEGGWTGGVSIDSASSVTLADGKYTTIRHVRREDGQPRVVDDKLVRAWLQLDGNSEFQSGGPLGVGIGGGGGLTVELGSHVTVSGVQIGSDDYDPELSGMHEDWRDNALGYVLVDGDGSVLKSEGESAFTLYHGYLEVRNGGLVESICDGFFHAGVVTGDSVIKWQETNTMGSAANIVPDGENDEIATLTFDTDEFDTSLGMTYHVDIEKVGGATDNDVLQVTGDANLGGVLDVTALPDASGIEAGDSFSILTSVGSLTGEFDFEASNLPDLNAGLTWEIFYDRDDYTTVNDPAFLNQWVGNGVKDVVLYVDEIDVSIDDQTMVEADGTMLFNVELSRSSQSEVTVDWATIDGSATAGDYQADSGQVTFEPGETQQQISVNVYDDYLDEPDESFYVDVSFPGGDVEDQGTGTILDNDTTIYISDSQVSEEYGYMIFDLTLGESSQSTVTVDYVTVDGSAEAGSDFEFVGGTVTFQPGETSSYISVSVTDDSLDEYSENFSIVLSNSVNAEIIDGVGIGTIDDNDDPPVLNIADTTVAENVSSGKAEFTVSLSEVSGKDVSVYYYTSDSGGEHLATAGIDYTEVQSGSVFIAAGQTSATAEVYINNDSLDECDETFAVTLSSAVNATLGDSDAVGTITDDDDPPLLSIADASGLESDGSMLFDVELSAVSGKDVTAYYYTSASSGSYPATAGTDYSEVQDGWLFIAAGQTGTTAEVYIDDDYIDEYPETFDVTLTSADNATIAPDNTAEGTIIDDDGPPEISIYDAYAYEGDGNLVFNVQMSTASGKQVTVDYATSDGSATAGQDYAAASGTVTFEPDETVATVTVGVTQDSLDEDDEETLAVTLSNATNATISDDYREAEGTIYDDDDPPTVSIAGATVAENVSGGKAVFNVTLSEQTGKDVTVYYDTADDPNGEQQATAGDDYSAVQNGSVQILAGETAATIEIGITNDSLDEYNETFLVSIASAVNATLGQPSSAVGTINDDDDPPVISISGSSASEIDGQIEFAVQLSAASGKDVTAYYYTSASSGSYPAAAGTDYSEVQGDSLFIAAGQTATARPTPLLQQVRRPARSGMTTTTST